MFENAYVQIHSAIKMNVTSVCYRDAGWKNSLQVTVE